MAAVWLENVNPIVVRNIKNLRQNAVKSALV
jgi:hypothetical protein